MQPPSFSPESWLQALQWRYATKRFDPDRRIDDPTWQAIEQSMILTPSSFGLQPWKFVVIESREVKEQLPAISWGQSQPMDCSHMVVFASLRELTPEYVGHFLEEIARIRSTPLESLDGYRKVILGFIEATRGTHSVWSAHQAYIALGQLMATAAALGIDACPMEGIAPDKYDALLGLNGSPYATRVACALGYRHPDDGYARNAKVRFHPDEVIVRI
ncbi:MAG: NAD(P)H-dependent oxidoreductase [Planctomycetota bacterium]|jgi:nitroreductase